MWLRGVTGRQRGVVCGIPRVEGMLVVVQVTEPVWTFTAGMPRWWLACFNTTVRGFHWRCW